MNQNRELKIGIKNDKEFFDELKEIAGRIDDGWLPVYVSWDEIDATFKLARDQKDNNELPQKKHERPKWRNKNKLNF